MKTMFLQWRGVIGTLVFAAVLAGAPAVAAESVEGAGSTFVAPVIAKWAAEYAREKGVTVHFQAVGSGVGIEKIKAGEVDFGASDKPLDPAELTKEGLCQFPVVIGGVVPVVNLPGVGPGKIKFSGQLLADIFMGKVKRWDDPAIRAINSSLNLPALRITVIHRSDGSGTTYNWVDFLAKASREWKNKIGVGLTVNWPAGVGGSGNAGVADTVKGTVGAIGYVEYAYALQSRLAYGQVANLHNLYMAPRPETFEAAAETVDWRQWPDFAVLMTNAGGPSAYPITATTFVLMHKVPKDRARSAAAFAFFKWALEHGDQEAAELNYVALPPSVVVLVEQHWAAQIRHGTEIAGANRELSVTVPPRRR